MKSESYPEGRIDSYTIKLTKEYVGHFQIIPLFLDLGFTKEEVDEKLDVTYNEEDFIFIYGNPKIKAYIITGENVMSIKFDTNLSREEIDKIMKRYFLFPE